MSGAQVHFELFARRKMNAAWTLEAASEDRAGIVEQAEEMLAQGRAAAVKVTKETLDRESGEFKTVTVLSKGAVEQAKKGKLDDEDDTPLCVTPADLYTIHARERIGRLLDGWLLRQRVTPFELLHRPDLVEQLDASGDLNSRGLELLARLYPKLGRGDRLLALGPRLKSAKELPESQVSELLAQVQLEEVRAAGESGDQSRLEKAWSDLPRGVRRTIVGFMGCYAGITGLRTASDIVRADPEARVLMINLELCTLHLQQDAPIDRLVASMLFSDGCAASLISAKPEGFRLDSFSTILSLDDADKMSWLVEDQGFAMTLDAEIPNRIRDFLERDPELFDHAARDPQSLWAIHPGGRAILDAVRAALSLSAEQIAPARKVLANYGNMSSASVIFVFEELLRSKPQDEMRPGGAIAFGPGLTLEALEFTAMPRAGRPRTSSHDRQEAALPAIC